MCGICTPSVYKSKATISAYNIDNCNRGHYNIIFLYFHIGQLVQNIRPHQSVLDSTNGRWSADDNRQMKLIWRWPCPRRRTRQGVTASGFTVDVVASRWSSRATTIWSATTKRMSDNGDDERHRQRFVVIDDDPLVGDRVCLPCEISAASDRKSTVQVQRVIACSVSDDNSH